MDGGSHRARVSAAVNPLAGREKFLPAAWHFVITGVAFCLYHPAMLHEAGKPFGIHWFCEWVDSPRSECGCDGAPSVRRGSDQEQVALR
jgi:hypothetical protein